MHSSRYVREWINGMVCAKIIDHLEIEGADRYWIESYRLPALLGDSFEWPAVFSELMVAGAAKMSDVEKCFPVDGPNGENAI